MNLKTALTLSKLRHQAANHRFHLAPSRAAAKRPAAVVRADRRQSQTASMLHPANNHPKPFGPLACYMPETVRMKLARLADRRIRRALERSNETK